MSRCQLTRIVFIFFLFYKNTNLVGDLNMFNVHNLIEISHHNDKYCTFYPKNDSSFTHFWTSLMVCRLKDLICGPNLK